MNLCYRVLNIFLLLRFIEGCLAMEPALKIYSVKDSDINFLQNGDFEITSNDLIQSWYLYKNGYKIATGRNSSISAYCKNENIADESGISQRVDLNQKIAIPILIRGWSRAINVSGSKDSGYSIYVDIIYQDNTPLWGQTAEFNTGTHDWEMQEITIVPAKPIKHLTVYGIFRNHTGEVFFDDFQLYEIGKNGACLFDNIPISIRENHIKKSDDKLLIRTNDDLSISYNLKHGLIETIKIDDKELTHNNMPSGFIVRDVYANSDFYTFKDNICQELGLSLDVNIGSSGQYIFVEGKVSDTTGNDRAITLAFTLPIEAIGWKWHDDLRHYRIIEKDMEYINGVNMHTGSSGILSLYPFACISNDNAGIAMAIDMGMPAQYRIAYNSSLKQFFIAYDFGLTKDTDNFPSSAPFRFIIYKIDPEWGYRSAAKKLYDIFSDYFVCRSKDQGIWMPFTDVSTVEGWEDFGFKYHEGINNVPFDDKANILSFRYTEPSTWWMRIDPKIDRTDENIIKILYEYANSDDPRFCRPAQATLVSGSFDEQGRYQYRILDTPWCNGAVFSSNPNPYIPGNSEARMNWNEDIKQRLYGDKSKGEQDGEYLDSLEGYVTANENFRREHFHYVNVPLTFSISSRKPVIHKAFSVYEFSKWLADDIHKMGKLMFANSVPHNFAFLCPFFDIMGTEMNWVSNDGSWQPASDEWMLFKRTMCYQKPYLFLMNTRFEFFPPYLVEKYFQRSLFYGMFPSMFSHNASEDPYWQSPELYNRDRHLFKKYIPLIKKIAEAGWEPITYAGTDNDRIYIERFGPDKERNVYFTILNDSNETLKSVITIMDEMKISTTDEIKDLINDENVKVITDKNKIQIPISMSSEQVRLLCFKCN